MSHLVTVAPVVAEHRYSQSEITATIGPLLTSSPDRRAVLDRFHAASGVDTRHLALPLEKYAGLTSFDQANDLFVAIGSELAERAVSAALADAGLTPTDVDFLLFTSVTGVSAPSIDALLVGRLGLRPDVKRLPSFGLGCVAGAAGIARVHDYLVGHPHDVAVLLSVELCSLTAQHGDDSTANLVSSGIFGDGAAAVVMVGDERAASMATPGLEVVGARSVLYPDSTGALGWDIGGSGFRIVLGAGLADVVEQHIGADVQALLAAHGAAPAEVTTWIAHAGGPRILEAAEHALSLPPAAFARSRASLARVGNLSSASVLHILSDVLADGDPAPGGLAVLFAFGPGVSAEVVLLRRPVTGGRP
ncbi:MAG TPA: 3-oxoacyl-[acyl-carrier-protein] synthase III C-terminal domain-containing protein [Cellulomonas sp.]|uniref:type III polyketide synthase n=1 Tax=Cellulomonas sp. TaxID=40001 RepID=UPI002E353E01|nr:3-oxoacyl-[acyl-carrier-protein] synthase III C-terminal domain-containing protein [Cellulomonas sp.]HEX5333522.1 3-oxoacyl-[acyl-carrier-protein] synthase III C-terminal domain-containing protein [Cellulomonas sp.]